MKVNCPYITCKFNSSNIIDTLGECLRDEITLLTSSMDEDALDCASYFRDYEKHLDYKE